MFNPKKEIYSVLSNLGYDCSQGSQAVFNNVPAITFTIGDNVPRYTLEKNVEASDVEVVVDVWANDSITASRIASEAEAAMRSINYLLSYSADVPAPEGSLYHIQMRFDGIK